MIDSLGRVGVVHMPSDVRDAVFLGRLVGVVVAVGDPHSANLPVLDELDDFAPVAIDFPIPRFPIGHKFHLNRVFMTFLAPASRVPA